MRAAILAVAMLAACGPPALQNAPRPNPSAVAGAAAAIAGAATLADPDAAARKANAEQNKDNVDPDHTVPVHETVPEDVFDRLDAKKAQPEPAPVASEPR